MNMQPSQPLARWVVGYGLFLIAIGVVGFLSNPEKAATALISGGTFGGLSLLWGILMARGKRWSRTAALVTTLLLTVPFGWRAVLGWKAVAAGQSEKVVAATLISLMLAASVVMIRKLICQKTPVTCDPRVETHAG